MANEFRDFLLRIQKEWGTEDAKGFLPRITLDASKGASAILRPIRELLGPSLPGNVAPKLIYHYTNAVGLLGIVSSRSIWASHAKFLNDRAEGTVGDSVFRQELLIGGLSDAAKSAVNYVLDAHVYHKRGDPHLEYYVCSFSELGDDLSQWRGYGHGGSGVAIGFQWSKLCIVGPVSQFALGPVVYDAVRQRNYARSVLSGFGSEFAATTSQEDREYCLFKLITAISASMALFKDPAFAAEREWRLYRTINHLPTAKKVQYRGAPGTIIPYHVVQLEVEGMNPIAEVCVGPVASQDNMVRALAQMSTDGVLPSQVVVCRSNVPLR